MRPNQRIWSMIRFHAIGSSFRRRGTSGRIMSGETEGSGEGRTDIAALAAGAMAVAISMFLISGPFDALGAMVAVTLTLVIIGYVWKHRRSILQSLAVAALLGIVAIPIAGFAL